jgi:hypothetical protein
LTRRDRQYLKWRFNDNPVVNYRVLGYFSDGQLQGYLVFNIYRGDQFQIVDMFGLPQPKIARELIKSAIIMARELNMKIVKMWMPIHNWFHIELERIGFVNREPITHFGARILKADTPIGDIWDVRRWHFSMSDCDNF